MVGASALRASDHEAEGDVARPALDLTRSERAATPASSTAADGGSQAAGRVHVCSTWRLGPTARLLSSNRLTAGQAAGHSCRGQGR